MVHCKLPIHRAAQTKERIIGQNRNTFAKRAREMDKKRKAETKRANRRIKNEQTPEEKALAAKMHAENQPDNLNQ